MAVLKRYTGTEWETVGAPIGSSALNRLWFPAKVFDLVGVGAPTYSGAAASTFGSWAFDAAATEAVSVSFVVPNDWATIDVDLYWTATTGTGNCVWALVTRDTIGDGGDLTTAGTSNSFTLAAAGNNLLAIDSIGSGLTVVQGEVMTLRPTRTGGDGADTMANDAHLIGLLVKKAS